MARSSIDQRRLIRGVEVFLRRNRRARGSSSLLGVLVVIAAVALVVLRGWAPARDATVVEVLDGDSLVFLQDGQRREVRLFAIDAPEKGQAYGSEARAFTRDLVLHRPVTLRIHDEDRYQRLVSDVVLADGRILNHELVREGLAWWYDRHAPDSRTLKRLERQARDAQRGLWSEASPLPPWEFRTQQRASGRP